MSESWSKIRKILEQDRLCLKLQGRVRYYYTLYRKSHDQAALFEVKVDDEMEDLKLYLFHLCSPKGRVSILSGLYMWSAWY